MIDFEDKIEELDREVDLDNDNFNFGCAKEDCELKSPETAKKQLSEEEDEEDNIVVVVVVVLCVELLVLFVQVLFALLESRVLLVLTFPNIQSIITITIYETQTDDEGNQ